MKISDIVSNGAHFDAVASLRYDATTRSEVLYYLESLREELAGLVAKYDPTKKRTEMSKHKALQQLISEVDALIDEVYSQIEETSRDHLVMFWWMFYSVVTKNLNESLGSNVFPKPDPSRLGDLKRKAATNVRELMIVGANLSEWWSRQAFDLKNSVRDQIRMGFNYNESLEGILERLRGTPTTTEVVTHHNEKEVKFDGSVGGVLTPAIRAANLLVRTAVQGVSNNVRMEFYKYNDGLIQGIEALVTLDNRTSDLCRSRAGYRWYLDGSPMEGTPMSYPGTPPWHYYCRTVIIPVFHTPETANMDDLSERQQAFLRSISDNSPVSPSITYESWLKSQPESVQLEVLGPKRFELYKAGKITFADLIDQTGRPLTYKELKELAGE